MVSTKMQQKGCVAMLWVMQALQLSTIPESFIAVASTNPLSTEFSPST